ncbi:leucine-rich repeat protein [Carboxylicivirga sp. M1479]|uniref:leucine-rich repeat protein n=1 Tax=Carboxylicivirga sp. M1479 TaxID=2594476 RepID=UPI00117842CF|nr:leucine-rich repeat protein [Carboxylicivirga sp. M1479]TRX72450.1 leucine-rich repeat protein [Carboxylicivirga sp. M1479]
MREIIGKTASKLVLVAVIWATFVDGTKAQYTLKDADVEMTTDGLIQSCSYDFAIKDIIIPATLDGQAVKGIKDARSYSSSDFYYKGITSITFPEGMTHIGDYAFCNNSITTVNLPSTLQHIGMAAFNSNVITRANGQAVDGLFYARKDDASIDYTRIVSYGGATKSLIVTSTVETIGEDALVLSRLTSIDFTNATALKTIERSALYSLSVPTIDLSNCSQLTSIGQYGFMSCGIENLDLSGCTSLSDIGGHAFYNNRIEKLDLSNCTALLTVGFESFRNNSITDLALPPNATTIYSAAFNNNQITIIDDEPSEGFIYKRNVDTTDDLTQLISYGGVSRSVVVPAQVERINSSCFNLIGMYAIDLSNCTKLTYIGHRALASNNLNTIDLSTCTALEKIESYAFAYNRLPEANLSQCTKLSYIGSKAFYSNTLSSFNLPTPAIDGFTFKHWLDDEKVTYAGGTTVTDVHERYQAILSAYYDVSFTVLDGIAPIEGAIVEIEGQTAAIASAEGKVSFTNIYAGNYSYTITANGYESAAGSISVDDVAVSKTVSLSLATALNQLEEIKLSIYPNPVINTLNIKQSNSNITLLDIYNYRGIKIKSKTITNAENDIQVDVQNLASGLYIIKCLTQNGHTITKQFVKSKATYF